MGRTRGGPALNKGARLTYLDLSGNSLEVGRPHRKAGWGETEGGAVASSPTLCLHDPEQSQGRC